MSADTYPSCKEFSFVAEAVQGSQGTYCFKLPMESQARLLDALLRAELNKDVLLVVCRARGGFGILGGILLNVSRSKNEILVILD